MIMDENRVGNVNLAATSLVLAHIQAVDWSNSGRTPGAFRYRGLVASEQAKLFEPRM
jgi:hypothetical protein